MTGSVRHLDCFRLGRLHLLHFPDDGRRLHDIDASLEIGSIVDHNAGGFDVADEAPVPLNRDFFGDFDVALHVARNHHLARPDVGLTFPRGPMVRRCWSSSLPSTSPSTYSSS